MVDELERLRRMREDAPSPDASWVDETRNDLLAMADAEVREAEQPDAAPAPSAWERFLVGLRSAFRRPAVAVASILLLAVAGWGIYESVDDRAARQPEVAQPTAPTAPTTAGGSPGMELAASCSNTESGFTVSYPGDWNTNSGETFAGCQVFDPQPLDLEEDVGGGVLGAINIRRIPASVDEARDPGPAAALRSTEETSVAGRPAVRQLLQYTGETSIPEGVRGYRYLVELDDGALLAITYDVGDDATFERKREILDQMMRTIELGAVR